MAYPALLLIFIDFYSLYSSANQAQTILVTAQSL